MDIVNLEVALFHTKNKCTTFDMVSFPNFSKDAILFFSLLLT